MFLRFLRSSAIPVFLVILFIITLSTMINVCFQRTIDSNPRLQKHPVGKTTPAQFPILVISPVSGGSYEARIAFKWSLNEYLKNTPGHTFIVPNGQEDLLNKNLDAKYTYYNLPTNDQGSYPCGTGGFKVEKRLPNGHQLIKVNGTWDDDRVNIGWYEASREGFKPLYYQFYFGPGVAMSAGFSGFAANFMLWLIGVIGYNVYRRKKGQNPNRPFLWF